MNIRVQYDPQQCAFRDSADAVEVVIKSAPSDANVRAGVTQGFAIARITVFDVERTPHGDPLGDTLVKESNGATPLAVEEGQMIKVQVSYSGAPDPEAPVSGQLQISARGAAGRGDTWAITVPLRVPIAHLVGNVEIDSALNSGEVKTFSYTIASTLAHDADVLLQYDGTYQPLFFAQTQHIRVPKGGQAGGTIPIGRVPGVIPVGGVFGVRFVVSESNGAHPASFFETISALGPTLGARSLDIPLIGATQEMHQFHLDNQCLLRVGLPIGPVIRKADGSYLQTCTMGSIIKLQDGPDSPPILGEQTLIESIRIQGVRCFGTDDPSGEDEPYLISSIRYHHPEFGSKQQTIRTDITNSVKDGMVFLKGTLLNTDSILVPGEEPITLHLEMWEHESGDADDIRNKVSDAVQTGLAAAAAAITAALSTISLGLLAGVVSKVTGILASIGDAIGEAIKGIFDDDHIGTIEFLIEPQYLTALINDQIADTRSNSINDSYNFPQLPEDDSAAGRFWLFDGGAGGGQYRVFLQIVARRVGPPH